MNYRTLLMSVVIFLFFFLPTQMVVSFTSAPTPDTGEWLLVGKSFPSSEAWLQMNLLENRGGAESQGSSDEIGRITFSHTPFAGLDWSFTGTNLINYTLDDFTPDDIGAFAQSISNLRYIPSYSLPESFDGLDSSVFPIFAIDILSTKTQLPANGKTGLTLLFMNEATINASDVIWAYAVLDGAVEAPLMLPLHADDARALINQIDALIPDRLPLPEGESAGRHNQA